MKALGRKVSEDGELDYVAAMRYAINIVKGQTSIANYSGYDEDNMWSDAALGVATAIRTHDPDLGTLQNYAVMKAKFAILDGHRTRSTIPRSLHGIPFEDIPSRCKPATSLDEPRQKVGEDNDERNLHDMIPCTESEERFERINDNEFLIWLVDTLEPRDRDIIEKYYFDNLTLWQIGEIYGVTESRASQIKKQALYRMYHAALDDQNT